MMKKASYPLNKNLNLSEVMYYHEDVLLVKWNVLKDGHHPCWKQKNIGGRYVKNLENKKNLQHVNLSENPHGTSAIVFPFSVGKMDQNQQ